MGRKKSKKDLKPWCWYCEREFDDEKILIQHQKARHFKCPHCSKRLNTANGMAIHVAQVHKETISRVPNAVEDRDGFELEIFGTIGIPERAIEARREKLFSNSDPAPLKKQKTSATASAPVFSEELLKQQLEQHRSNLKIFSSPALDSPNPASLPPNISNIQFPSFTPTYPPQHLPHLPFPSHRPPFPPFPPHSSHNQNHIPYSPPPTHIIPPPPRPLQAFQYPPNFYGSLPHPPPNTSYNLHAAAPIPNRPPPTIPPPINLGTLSHPISISQPPPPPSGHNQPPLNQHIHPQIADATLMLNNKIELFQPAGPLPETISAKNPNGSQVSVSTSLSTMSKVHSKQLDTEPKPQSQHLDSSNSSTDTKNLLKPGSTSSHTDAVTESVNQQQKQQKFTIEKSIKLIFTNTDFSMEELRASLGRYTITAN